MPTLPDSAFIVGMAMIFVRWGHIGPNGAIQSIGFVQSAIVNIRANPKSAVRLG